MGVPTLTSLLPLCCLPTVLSHSCEKLTSPLGCMPAEFTTVSSLHLFQSLPLIQQRRLKVAPFWPICTSKCRHISSGPAPSPLLSPSLPWGQGAQPQQYWQWSQIIPCWEVAVLSTVGSTAASWPPPSRWQQQPQERTTASGKYGQSHGLKSISSCPLPFDISDKFHRHLSQSEHVPNWIFVFKFWLSSAELSTWTGHTGLFRAQTRHASQNLTFN